MLLNCVSFLTLKQSHRSISKYPTDPYHLDFVWNLKIDFQEVPLLGVLTDYLLWMQHLNPQTVAPEAPMRYQRPHHSPKHAATRTPPPKGRFNWTTPQESKQHWVIEAIEATWSSWSNTKQHGTPWFDTKRLSIDRKQNWCGEGSKENGI